jgi:hypothetical protein
MIFRPFYYFDRGSAAYLFGCGTLSDQPCGHHQVETNA